MCGHILTLWLPYVQAGDLVEPTLLNGMDAAQLVLLARSTRLGGGGCPWSVQPQSPTPPPPATPSFLLSRPKERRLAALEMSSMAAVSDDNRLTLLNAGGYVSSCFPHLLPPLIHPLPFPSRLPAIMQLMLSEDISTKQYAVEAALEMMCNPTCQHAFVQESGLRCLFACMHSEDSDIVADAVAALSLLCQEDSVKMRLLNEGGLIELESLTTRRGLWGERGVGAWAVVFPSSDLNTPSRAVAGVSPPDCWRPARPGLSRASALAHGRHGVAGGGAGLPSGRALRRRPHGGD